MGKSFACISDHAARRYLYTMQDTSNMLTRWAIALKSYDFAVELKPGKYTVIPDALSRLFYFEKIEEKTRTNACANLS